MAISARQLQLRRGTTAQHADFVGAEGEITFDTTTKRLRLHDHVQVGGYEIPKSNEVVHNTGDETVSGTKTFDVIKCTNPAADQNDTTVATTKFVNDRITASHAIPVGLIAPYAGSSSNVPTGWLMCNGQAVSRTTYSSLFAIVGTAYGAGDGSTTFNLPNYTDRVAQGLGRGYVAAGLPDIQGTWKSGGGHQQCGPTNLTGAYYKVADGNNCSPEYAAGGTAGTVGFKASRSSSIYGSSTTVQPPAVKSYWIIKY